MNEHAEHNDQAIQDLSYIRETMARTAPLTAVSGVGTMGMGVIALVGGAVATLRRSPDWWIYTWLVVACVGCLAGFAGMVFKARRSGQNVKAILNPRFLMNFVPPIVAGIAITEALYEGQLDYLMPGTWLLLYGTAVITGGAHAPRVVPLMGLFFMLLGAYALLVPIWVVNGFLPLAVDADLLLAIGFGGVHLFFGALIFWKYDG